ncbi:hypothetical protein [Niastella populi]|uniref:Uncharacterized protein n=1 Tax=Niastella populi TaxID=550983 RepID=A0A1V9FPL3_9BACT|nr:hypothetical protein [Niastella populi]OQP60282.1 hypothetical protein A4R26_20205 [Niastella populi]
MRELTSCIRKTLGLIVLCIFSGLWSFAQDRQPGDTAFQGHKHIDTIPFIVDSAEVALRIKNLNPYFTLHVDSTLAYKLEINKDQSKYYWFLRNPPVGLRINKDNGLLSFKVEKSFFLSGKLKYDYQYKVNVGVQNLEVPNDHVDTSFYITFYNTDIIQSRVKPTIGSTVVIDEGDTVAFKILCENGNFPIENITFFSNLPVKGATLVKKCDDDFIWSPSFDFVKESDPGKERTVVLSFVGANKFMVRDTAQVKIVVKDALNYPLTLEDYKLTVNVINSYVLRLKYTFLMLDKGVKNTKSTRTTFDITGSTTALTGSILSSSKGANEQSIGKVLPSVGVSLVPVKEAVAPQKVTEMNQASQVRTAIKRLEYMVSDNALVGERDPDIARKTAKLKEELKQMQVQLVDIPIEITSEMSEKELNQYFNSPKVLKKYRVKR